MIVFFIVFRSDFDGNRKIAEFRHLRIYMNVISLSQRKCSETLYKVCHKFDFVRKKKFKKSSVTS